MEETEVATHPTVLGAPGKNNKHKLEVFVKIVSLSQGVLEFIQTAAFSSMHMAEELCFILAGQIPLC